MFSLQPCIGYLAAIPALKLLVHAWYDDLPQKALASREGWGMVQAISQSERFGTWTHSFAGDDQNTRRKFLHASWMPLLYQPLGSVSPAANFLVSDSDFVEVLTEIDIQTPIPEAVQNIRKGRSFLFLGCRFSTQTRGAFPAADHEALLGPPLGGTAGGTDAQRDPSSWSCTTSSGLLMPLVQFAASAHR